MARKYEPLKVDTAYKISDGNGGTLNAKVIEVRQHGVHYVTRPGPKGRWGRAVYETSHAKFRRLMADAA